MSAKLETIEIVVREDWDADTSYLEQSDFAMRLDEYKRGEFEFVGVQLRATISIPHGEGFIEHDVTTPGLWGIESDSGEDYYRSVAQDEAETLVDMLHELAVQAATGGQIGSLDVSTASISYR